MNALPPRGSPPGQEGEAGALTPGGTLNWGQVWLPPQAERPLGASRIPSVWDLAETSLGMRRVRAEGWAAVGERRVLVWDWADWDGGSSPRQAEPGAGARRGGRSPPRVLGASSQQL